MSKSRDGHTPDHHFRVSNDLWLPARAKAEREGRTMTWLVKHALTLYLRDQLPVLPLDIADGESPPPGAQETGSGG